MSVGVREHRVPRLPVRRAYLNNPGYLSLAARIGGVEAYHSGYLNALANLPTLVPDGSPFLFLEPLTPQGVVADLTPFIASLNGGPTPGYQVGVRSDANDIAILNFAYVLELLECTFYVTNVPDLLPLIGPAAIGRVPGLRGRMRTSPSVPPEGRGVGRGHGPGFGVDLVGRDPGRGQYSSRTSPPLTATNGQGGCSVQVPLLT